MLIKKSLLLLKISLQLLAVIFLCAVELFGIFSPYIQLINIVFLLPLVIIYVFYSNNERKNFSKIIAAGILVVKLIPIVIANNLRPGNFYLFGSSSLEFVMQVEADLFLLNFFPHRKLEGMIILLYVVLGFLLAKIAARIQRNYISN